MEKIIYITKKDCINCDCILVRNDAVDINTCTGCWVGTFEDCTIWKRIDSNFKQLTIFDFGVS